MYKTLLEVQQLPLGTEKHDETVITIPNQALSPSQILMLYKQGRQGELPQFRPAYQGKEDDTGRFIPDLTKLDKIEREQYYKGIVQELKENRQKHEKYVNDLEQEKSHIEYLQRSELERKLRQEITENIQK